MKVIPQYTIRNMPESIDRYLRKRAKQTGRSLNQTIIDELSERSGITKDGKKQNLLDSLSWFIGSGEDQNVTNALEADDRIQKRLARQELEEWQKQDANDH